MIARNITCHVVDTRENGSLQIVTTTMDGFGKHDLIIKVGESKWRQVKDFDIVRGKSTREVSLQKLFETIYFLTLL
jgi:hypothetical protein